MSDPNAQPQQHPGPDPALRRLNRFVGTWDMKGRTLDSEVDNVSGRTTFEWLSGGFFLGIDARFRRIAAGPALEAAYPPRRAPSQDEHPSASATHADGDTPYMFHNHILQHDDRGMMGQSLSSSPAKRPEASFGRAVVLVEGISDQLALEALAERRGRNLDAEGVSVVPIGGAQAIGRFLNLFGPQGLDVRLAGLCDAAEEGDFRRGLEQAGFGSHLTRVDMEALGFYVCVADLEDELIRALGAASVEQIVDRQGDLGSFRTLQKQPAWQGRTNEEQLRRFMGSGGSRKIRYARLLVDALDLSRVPRPLDGVLAHVGSMR